MGHDQLFKAVLQAYFREFLQLFYPDVAEHLDFETLRFLDKELFTDFPEGSPREVDVVAWLQTHEGNSEIVLVHIEVEADWSQAFAERMHQYYSLLRLRYRIPVVPVVVYLRGGQEGIAREEYREGYFGREYLRFRYDSVRLAPLPAEEYLKKGTPLAAALAALMDRRQAREPLSVRAWMLQRVAESEKDDAEKFLLLNVIETYFKLTAEQKESFSMLLSKKEYREAGEMELTWADEMRKEGLMAGKRETLLRLLARKFGPLPEQAASRVRAIESRDELDDYLDRVLTAQSLDEMGLGA